MGMKFQISADGSFSVCKGPVTLLEDCYPGINQEAVRPIRMVVEEPDRIRMETIHGEIQLTLSEKEGETIIESTLSGGGEKVHDFSPVFRGKVPGAKGLYQVSGQTGGETGYYGMEAAGGSGRLSSAGICAAQLDRGAVTLYFEEFRYTDNYFVLEWEEEALRITAVVQTEETPVCERHLPPLRVGYAERLQDGLRAAADRIARKMEIHLEQPPSYNWCSWYYCYHNFDRRQLQEYLQGFRKVEGAEKLRYILVDAGYSAELGDWLCENEKWEGGLRAAFQMIREAGYRPAIWIGPYMVGNRSRLYQEHPDWVLRDLGGAPVRALITDNEPKLWDYQDEEYYVLDSSHPEAMSYMRTVFRTLRSWGAEMFKTDFMLWGLRDSTKVRRHCPGKTSVEYFREFLQMIREEIGKDSFWLGCIAPFFPFLGYADGMRIGGDVGSSWDGNFGPKNMIRSVMGNGFMNHCFFENDPDVVMLRDRHIRLTAKEIESLALFEAFSGCSVYTSDPLHLIGEDRRKLFRFIRPAAKRRAEQPFLDQERADRVLLQRSTDGNRALLFVLNPGETVIRERYSAEELGMSGKWQVRKLSGYGYAEQSMSADIWAEVEPHGYLLLSLVSSEKEDRISGQNQDVLWKYLEIEHES